MAESVDAEGSFKLMHWSCGKYPIYRFFYKVVELLIIGKKGAHNFTFITNREFWSLNIIMMIPIIVLIIGKYYNILPTLTPRANWRLANFLPPNCLVLCLFFLCVYFRHNLSGTTSPSSSCDVCYRYGFECFDQAVAHLFSTRHVSSTS